jgi:hypothetical protein
MIMAAAKAEGLEVRLDDLLHTPHLLVCLSSRARSRDQYRQGISY